MRKPYIIQPLSQEDVERAFAAFSSTPVGRRNRLIAQTLYYSGLRSQELIDLHINDIDFRHMILVVQKGKGGRRRHVGIPHCLCDRLNLFCRGRQPDERVFATRSGVPLTTTYLRRVFRRIENLTGLRFNPHALRHSHAMQLAERHVDFRIIQAQLGHSSIAVTDHYIRHLGMPQRISEVQRAFTPT